VVENILKDGKYRNKCLLLSKNILSHWPIPKDGKYRNKCLLLSKNILTHWSFCLSIGSLFIILLSWITLGVSPLYTFQEIAYQQEQDNLKREFVQFHNELGTQFLYVEEIDAARNEFNQVLKVDPYNQNAAKGLFECDVFGYVENQSYNPVIIKTQLDQLSNKYPDDPLPYLYLGDFAWSWGYTDSATNFYQEAIKRNSSVAAAYFGLGNIYEENNQLDRAREMFQEAVNLSYWNIMYRNNLAYVCYESQDYNNSIFWYSGSVDIDPRHIDQYIGYSNSCRCLNDLDTAIELQENQIYYMENNETRNLTCNQGIVYYPYDSGHIYIYTYDTREHYYYYNIALTYYLLGNENKTLEYLKKADDLHLDTETISNNRMIVNYDIENLQKAQPELMNKTVEFRNKFLN